MADNIEGPTGGHGKWRKVGVPHSGWTCLGFEDLGKNLSICEMCEQQEIRYAHSMTHPDYPDELACGCICAGHMEGDIARARLREKPLRNAATRRARWLRRKWHTSAKGNAYLRADGFAITVFPHGPGWKGTLVNRATDRRHNGTREHKTSDEAKLSMFDALTFITSGNGQLKAP